MPFFGPLFGGRQNATLLACALLGLAACAKPPGNPNLTTNNRDDRKATNTPLASVVTVIDETGAPVNGAKILIGPRVDTPFTGNFFSANSGGTATLPTAWTQAEPVTIDAPGFVRATYYDRLPSENAFTLRHAPAGTNFELQGETTGYGDIPDGTLEAGIVLPAFSRGGLAILDPFALISSQTDTLSVFGQSLEVPGNVSIPSQTQTYIFPLSISKPAYHIEFTHAASIAVSAVQLHIPLQEVISFAQNGDALFALLNKFTFAGGSLTTVDVADGGTSTDLAVNTQMYSPQFRVTAPSIPSNQELLVVAAPESNGAYGVSDLKTLTSGQTAHLMAPQNASPNSLVVSVLRKALDHESSTGAQNMNFAMVISPAQSAHGLRFLDAVAAPSVNGNVLKIAPPKLAAGVQPLLTYALRSTIEVIDKGHYKLEKKTPEWEFFTADWSNQLELPQWPNSNHQDSSSASHKRWEAVFAGQATSGNLIGKTGAKAAIYLGTMSAQHRLIGPETLEKATHVTRSAVDL